MKNISFNLKQFLIIVLLSSIWIHIAEVTRAFFVAFPLMSSFFEGKFQIIGLDQAQISHGLIWGLWDTLLTAILVFIYWLTSNTFGHNFKSAFIAGTTTALATIGIFWIANVNTGLGDWSTAFILFPLAWIEMIIGAWIAMKLYTRNK